MLIDKNASKNMAWVQRFHYIGRLKVYPVFGVRDKFQAILETPLSKGQNSGWNTIFLKNSP